MRSPHHLHSVFDVAPLSGFFGVARVLASLGILGRLGDSLKAVLLEHLTRDHVNLYFGYHVALLKFDHAPEPQRPMPARSKRRRTGSLDPYAILRLSIRKEERSLRASDACAAHQRQHRAMQRAWPFGARGGRHRWYRIVSVGALCIRASRYSQMPIPAVITALTRPCVFFRALSL